MIHQIHSIFCHLFKTFAQCDEKTKRQPQITKPCANFYNSACLRRLRMHFKTAVYEKCLPHKGFACVLCFQHVNLDETTFSVDILTELTPKQNLTIDQPHVDGNGVIPTQYHNFYCSIGLIVGYTKNVYFYFTFLTALA